MKSLDELLSQKAQELYSDELVKLLDPSTWDSSNRDTKLVEIRTLTEGICTLACDMIRSLLETTHNDKPLIWHKVRQQFIIGEITMLTGFREELDTADDITAVPVSYEWLNKQIRSRYEELVEINNMLADYETEKVEEL